MATKTPSASSAAPKSNKLTPVHVHRPSKEYEAARQFLDRLIKMKHTDAAAVVCATVEAANLLQLVTSALKNLSPNAVEALGKLSLEEKPPGTQKPGK
ncbi:hypothetical protein L1049_021639 [Liquidambar formosana]|uniref:Uncharacterized protein n=1 Tax=Liquidambar formosana TaxID=63359 RepID=A0AAP0N8J9_LIQFO